MKIPKHKLALYYLGVFFAWPKFIFGQVWELSVLYFRCRLMDEAIEEHFKKKD